jgi:hypothetical protein
VDAHESESGYDILDSFGQKLEKVLDENQGMPTAARIIIEGETAAHDDILSDVERWTNEFRAAALEIGAGKVWVEKTKFNISEPISDMFPEQAGGAISELLNLFDELSNDIDARRVLASELAEIGKKLPVELKSGSDEMQFDDTDWIADLLKQAKPMLIKRLLKKGIA